VLGARFCGAEACRLCDCPEREHHGGKEHTWQAHHQYGEHQEGSHKIFLELVRNQCFGSGFVRITTITGMVEADPGEPKAQQ
jgi:hypothetical protein